MNPTFLHRHRWNLTASAVVLLVYLAALVVLPKHVFWHPDDGAKFIQARSIHWDHGFRYALPYRGAARDPDFEFYPSRAAGDRLYPAPTEDGGVRFHWPIWFPLFSALVLHGVGLTGIYLVPLLSGWLTAVIAGRLVYAHSPPLAPVAIVLTGLGTPLCFYSLCFSEHTLATLCGMLALWAALPAGSRRVRLSAASILLVTSVVFRLDMLAFATAVVTGWAISVLASTLRPADHPQVAEHPPHTDRALPPRWFFLVVIAGSVLALVALLATSVTPRHWQSLASLPELLRLNTFKLPFLPDILRQVLINAPGLGGPLASRPAEFIVLAAFALCLFAPFIPWRPVEAAVLLPSLAVLVQFGLAIGLASRPYIARQGVFAIAPFLAVALYALPYAWRERRYALFELACTAAIYLALGFAMIVSTRVTMDGIYQVGLDGSVRYLLTLYPVWTVVSIIALGIYRDSNRPALLKSAFAALVMAMMLVAVLYQVRGIRMLHDNRQLIAKWVNALPEREPVLTNVWWLPAAVAPFFVDHEMYCLRELSELPRWLEAVTRQGMDTFTFVSRSAITPDQFPPGGVRIAPETSRFVDGMYVNRFRVVRGPD